MALFALLALALQPAPPPVPAVPREDPPEQLIDFLGRRQLCARIPPADERLALHLDEWRRLECGRLPAEERAWRGLHAGDPPVRAWLDLNPEHFRLNNIVVQSWHGPPGAHARRIEQTGSDVSSGARYRLVIDSDAHNGRTTLVTASYGDLPPRSLSLDNSRFPLLDLQSLMVALNTRPPNDGLFIELRFGYRRGYCGDTDLDDRPGLSISFDRERASASFEDRTNCRSDWISLTRR